MNGPVAAEEPEPAEHLRYARHLDELAQTSAQTEMATLVVVLDDPDTVMAESAIVHHIDRRAAQLLTDETFPDWAARVAHVIDGRAFAARRLREWTLLRAISTGQTWTAAEILDASDWFQRKAAEVTACAPVRALLADRGRTRRVRAAAGRRVQRPSAGE
ncbi:hypothetical protein [Nocardia brasiliensis]|uniref:hypothetical protein n=1 Tax=Nocardia brasiliensis TaxID=37326 RepID=UPI0024579B67|nr:hypothetical protein [Nocardia brasiliensis]